MRWKKYILTNRNFYVGKWLNWQLLQLHISYSPDDD